MTQSIIILNISQIVQELEYAKRAVKNWTVIFQRNQKNMNI